MIGNFSIGNFMIGNFIIGRLSVCYIEGGMGAMRPQAAPIAPTNTQTLKTQKQKQRKHSNTHTNQKFEKSK